LWAWGSNDYGQLGDGTTINRYYPVKVMDNVIAVSASVTHTMAIRTDGSLWAWGSNEHGQLGNGTVTVYGESQEGTWGLIEDNDQKAPIRIMENVVAVSAGSRHTMAIGIDGSLWAWGRNDYGQLGNGTITTYDSNFWEIIEDNNQSTPIRILSNVVYVSAGQEHTMAIKADGNLWAWGSNRWGEIGNGIISPYDPELNPVKVMEDVIAVSASSTRTMAIRSDGSLWGWGSWGIGDGTGIGYGIIDLDRPNPVEIMEDMVCVSGTMAIKADGSLWGWGSNSFGEIGDGTTITQYYPVRITEGIVSVSSGGFHTMAIKEDGSLWTWGRNDFGQLGDGTVSIVDWWGDGRVEDDNDQHSPVKIKDSVLFPVEQEFIQNGEGYIAEIAVSEDVEITELEAHLDPLYKAVLEEFLSEFLTIFQYGWKNIDTGDIYIRDIETGEFALSNEIPLVSLGGIDDFSRGVTGLAFNGTFFDQYGDDITEAPFIIQSYNPEIEHAIASNFHLYDLDDSNIPKIVIDTFHWETSTWGSNGAPKLYRFIDGKYQHVHTFAAYPTFFVNSNDRIIVNYTDAYYGVFSLYYIKFIDYEVEIEIIEKDYEELFFEIFLDSGATSMTVGMFADEIYGMELTQMMPLTYIQNSITESIRQRLGLTDSSEEPNLE